jgi:transcriptional regulator with XRE-family HTH domain
MKDRIVKFLISEKISPAEFADKIGVQRSSMSHILNGRNFPSASFLQKMLQAYPLLNPRWLMVGVGEMNTGTKEAITIFEKVPLVTSENDLQSLENEAITKIDPAENMGLLTSSSDVSIVGNNVNIHTNRDINKNENLSNPEKAQQDFAKEAINEKSASKQMSSLPVVLGDLREIEQILFFYKDKTFTVYKPS